MNFYMELDEDVANSGEAYMQFTLPNGDTPKVYVNAQSDESLPYASKKDVDGKTYYVFKCSVAAKEMNATITAQMIDGENEGQTYEYTVRDYAKYILDHSDDYSEELINLVKAMLNYGSFAQIYFDPSINYSDDDRLACHDLDTDMGAVEHVDVGLFAQPYDASNSDIPESVTFKGASLSLKSETTISIYLESEEELRGFEDGPHPVEVKHTGNQYVARMRNYVAKDLICACNLDFYTSAGDFVHIQFSPLNYCYEVVNDGSADEKLQNLCKALYCYWLAANDYCD